MDKNDSLQHPQKTLRTIDVVALVVGIVIGAGVFKAPALVAGNTVNGFQFMLSWLLGGIVSLIGALSYAELTSSYPHAGGDYHFLYRAYGKRVAFLFAWARMTVIQTGSIALLAFIFGDYATQIYSLGTYSSGIYAFFLVLILTLINIWGLNLGARTQKLFTLLEVGGIILIILAGLTSSKTEASLSISEGTSFDGSFGMAMVFVLLTFGGWNEAAYISSEIKSGTKNMAYAMIWSLIVITLIYLLVNMVYLRVLGQEQLAASQAVAADLMRLSWGEKAAMWIGGLIAISTLTSVNATIITGARSNYAVGKDIPFFSFLGTWNERSASPKQALLLQALISLVMISLGMMARSGFETMVDYTAPVFWFFFLLVGIAVIILRIKEPHTPRPFKVPLYPVLPLLFCASSAFLLYSSLAYTGFGALLGVGVLLLGGLTYGLFVKPHSSNQNK